MKFISYALLTLGLLSTGNNAIAGACDTNSTSLGRNLTSKCGPKTSKDLCDTCADLEFNKVVTKVESCRAKLQETTDTFKSTTCAQKH